MERLLLDICLAAPVAIGGALDMRHNRIPRWLGLLYVWGGAAAFALRRLGPSWARTSALEAIAGLILAAGVFFAGYAVRRATRAGVTKALGDPKALLYIALAFPPRQALCAAAVGGLSMCAYAWARGDVLLLGGLPRSKSGRRYPFIPFLLAGLCVGLALFR